jgi:hypothetical protein
VRKWWIRKSLGAGVVGAGGIGAPSNLLDDDIDLVAVLHVEVLGALVLVDALAIEEEADVGGTDLHGGSLTLWRWQ